MTKLHLNFIKETISEEMKNEFFTAVQHEETSMLKTACEENIEKLNKRLKKEDITQEEMQALTVQLDNEKKILETLESTLAETAETSEKVINAMSEKNENCFGNKKAIVRNVLRILATHDNAKLVKYALVETFKGADLYNALETIHINSRSNDDGGLVLSKEVKEAYSKASQELETIIKTTFSLPFETPYTEKTRVKLTAADKKLLHDCYIKGFRNGFSENAKTGVVEFTGRQVKTLVKSKKDKKTGLVTYNYSGLYQTVCNIVLPHYFA